MANPNKTVIVFDLDGTLFFTETVALPAYYQAFDRLRREGLTDVSTPPDDVLNGSYGYTARQIWERLLPGHGAEARDKASQYVGSYEIEALESGRGRLYAEVASTLPLLTEQGYCLAMASNGAQEYVDTVLRTCGIAQHFQVAAAASAYKTTDKADLVRIVLAELESRAGSSARLSTGFMVGDRSSDVAAGRKNGLITVGCTYGYGGPEELAGCDVHLSRFSELPRMVASRADHAAR